jgi:hypothetical protein
LLLLLGELKFLLGHLLVSAALIRDQSLSLCGLLLPEHLLLLLLERLHVLLLLVLNRVLVCPVRRVRVGRLRYRCVNENGKDESGDGDPKHMAAHHGGSSVAGEGLGGRLSSSPRSYAARDTTCVPRCRSGDGDAGTSMAPQLHITLNAHKRRLARLEMPR